MTDADQKMNRPWFRANNMAASIGAILMTAEDYGRPAPKPDERRLGRFTLPPFQRPAVWTEAQKVRFIESIWGGLPLGSQVYNQPSKFNSPYDQWLFDRQQRITAILEYGDDQCPVLGYRWSELTRVDRQMFKMTPMSCLETQIEDLAELQEIYDRLAYGGTPHDPKDAEVETYYEVRQGREVWNDYEGIEVATATLNMKRSGNPDGDFSLWEITRFDRKLEV